jgi:hypothetical protein
MALAPILQHLELTLGGANIEGGAQRAQIVVIVDAVDAHVPAIDEEAIRLPRNVRMPNGVS